MEEFLDLRAPLASWTSCRCSFARIWFSREKCDLLCAALDHFIEGFPTYAGVLKEIKTEFETALNRVVVFARDNVQLRQQRSADKAARDEAVEKAYQKVPSQHIAALPPAATPAYS